MKNSGEENELKEVEEAQEKIYQEVKKDILAKQKEFEYKETHLARRGLEEEIKKDKWDTIFRWVLAIIITGAIGFLAWYLLF